MEDIKDENGNVIGHKEADDYKNKWFIGHDPEQIWDYERDGVWQLEKRKKRQNMVTSRVTSSILTKTGMEYWIRRQGIPRYKTPRYYWSWRNEFTFFKNLSLSFMMYSHVGQYGTFNRAANTAVNWYDRVYDCRHSTLDRRQPDKRLCPYRFNQLG